LQPFSPGRLLKRLQNKGIHLLPSNIDLQQVNINEKCSEKLKSIEDHVYRQIANTIPALDYISSDWNATLSSSQIGILVREACIYTCPNEVNEYDCVLVERDEISQSYRNAPELGLAPGSDGIQYSLVIGNDYGRHNLYSTDLRPDESTHLELSRTLVNRLTPEAMMRLKRTNQRFQKTVFTLFSMIRPYSQS
jgi:hypothetical protein